MSIFDPMNSSSNVKGYQSIGLTTPVKNTNHGNVTEKIVSFSSKSHDQVVYIAGSMGEQPKTPKKVIHGHPAIKKIGLAPLVVLIFYSVSGGPFGIEDIVRAGGPFYALLGFSLLLVWAVPEALITAELSTAMPEASGSVAWVDRAFGPFWAFQKGWLGWLSGVSDNALYPILFLDCLIELFDLRQHPDGNGLPSDDALAAGGAAGSGSTGSHGLNFSLHDISDDSSTLRWVIIVTLTCVLTYLSYRGLDVVGNVAIVVCLLSLMPFIVFCLLGSFQVDHTRWLVAPPGGLSGVDWRLLLNTFFWNINFWESAASFSGDVEDPGRNYPIGLGIAVGMVFLSCFIPVLVGTGISPDPYSEWSDGYFVRLAGETIGPWLGYWMMFGAAITNIGMFEAEMSSDAWQVAGMADTGILPKFLGHRNPYGAPTFGVLLSASGVICLGWLSFAEVIDMLNLLFCYGQAIEFFAFLWLRWAHPDMHRPYTVPINFVGMCVILAFPLAFIFIIIAISSQMALVVSGTLTLLGVFVYYLLEFSKAWNLCTFNTKDEVVWIEMQSIDPGDCSSFDKYDNSGMNGSTSPGGYLKRPRTRSRGTSLSSEGSGRSGMSGNHHNNNNTSSTVNSVTNGQSRNSSRGGSLRTSFSTQGPGLGTGPEFSEEDDDHDNHEERRWREDS